MQTPYKQYPHDAGETPTSQRSKDISAAILHAIPASASLKMLSIKDQEQRYSIDLGFREIESCGIIINEVDQWDDPRTRFGTIDLNFDPQYKKIGERILENFVDNSLYILQAQWADIPSTNTGEFEQLLKESGWECEKDPMIEQQSEMFESDFMISMEDFHSGLQDILRCLIESCLQEWLQFSSTIRADDILPIAYAHEKVLSLLNKPMPNAPGEYDRDTLESRVYKNRECPRYLDSAVWVKERIEKIFHKK